ncbi:MAG: SPASM domain-containing protein, partial [Kiritimatiellae bacterium]|nr:SPASM domain-containing protein [Kiritimatiellia bacterium]
EALFQRVLKELTKTPVQVLGLYFSGESLLHPAFEKLLDGLRGVLDAAPAFRPLIYMHTNGTLWTPARTEAILSRKVLRRVIWSIDGVNEVTFEHMRPGASYTVVLDQFEYLLNHRSPEVEIHVNNMQDAACRTALPDQRLQALFRRADQVRSFYPYDLSEGPSFGYYQTAAPSSFCCYSLDTVIVTTGGQLSLCCVDLNARNAFGNLYEESFEELYNGSIHRQYMEWMSRGERSRLPGCAQCTVGDGADSFAFGIPVQSPNDMTEGKADE